MTASEYFSLHRPQAKFFLGDKVYGKLNKIPFMGTVGNDRMINESDGCIVSVHLYLPILIDGEVFNVINVPRDSLSLLKVFK